MVIAPPTNIVNHGTLKELPLVISPASLKVPSGKLSQKTMERSTMFHGKIHYKWPASIAFCMFTRGYPSGIPGDSVRPQGPCTSGCGTKPWKDAVPGSGSRAYRVGSSNEKGGFVSELVKELWWICPLHPIHPIHPIHPMISAYYIQLLVSHDLPTI